MNWKLWKVGLIVAFFCAVADALGVYVAAESIIWGKVIAFAIIKGLGGAALWMKQHPAEDISFDTDTSAKPAKDPNTQGNGTSTLPLILLGALLIGCTPCVMGCKSTPAKIAVNASDSARITVEAALGAWDAYIVKNHPPLKQQEAVRSAWLTYKQSQLVVLDAAILLKQAQNAGTGTAGAQAALSGAIVDASNALADMLKLLRQFGVKI